MPSTDVTEKLAIGAMIRAALVASPHENPETAVEAVLAEIDPADYYFYLKVLIRSRISTEVNHLREQVQPRVSSRSTKRDLIRSEWWPSWLSQRILAMDGSYKFLRDATPADLRFAAQTRRTQAAQLVSNAEQFELLADAMERAHVTVLADLPEAQAAPVLERAA